MEEKNEYEKALMIMAMGIGMKYIESGDIEEVIQMSHKSFKPLKNKDFTSIGGYYHQKIDLMNEFLGLNSLQGQTDDFIRVLDEIISLANECKEKIKNAK